MIAIVLLLGVLLYSFFSRRFEQHLITLPIFITGFGWLFSEAGLGLVTPDIDYQTIHLLAEITLVLVLFSDAARINLKALLTDHSIPQRMLLIGMPLTILLGAIIAYWISPVSSLMAAFLIAAILTPTDAALGQSVVSNEQVPLRIRQALNIESGLNDGIAVPFVTVFAVLSMSAMAAGNDTGPDNLWLFSLQQVLLGPLVGIVLGYGGAKMLDWVINHKFSTLVYQGIAFLAIALLTFFVAEAIGGNGFIAAFVAGLMLSGTLKNKGEYMFEFMEGEGQLLTLFTFFIFGTVLLPLGLEQASWKTVLLAVLFLTVVRMVPVAIALSGLGLSWPTKFFLGWFGPRGLASVLFALLLMEQFSVPGSEDILASVVLTVTFSIVAHGLTALPLAQRYGRYIDEQQHQEEMTTVPDELLSKPRFNSKRHAAVTPADKS